MSRPSKTLELIAATCASILLTACGGAGEPASSQGGALETASAWPNTTGLSHTITGDGSAAPLQIAAAPSAGTASQNSSAQPGAGSASAGFGSGAGASPLAAAGNNTGASASSSTTAVNQKCAPVLDNMRRDDPAMARLAGAALLKVNALTNARIGVEYGGNSEFSIRFRATHSGALQSIGQWWVSNNGGYSAGTGGRIRIELWPDDGSSAHLPNRGGAPLGSLTFSPNMSDGKFANQSEQYRNLAWQNPPSVTAGQLYHVTYRNIDPDPAANYISVNNVWTHKDNGDGSPFLADSDWALLYLNPSNDNGWVDRTVQGAGVVRVYPSMALIYQDGYVDGLLRTEAGVMSPNRTAVASRAEPVRTIFDLGESREHCGLRTYFAFRSAGSVDVELLDKSQQVIDKVRISDSANESLAQYPGYPVLISKQYDLAWPAGPHALQKGYVRYTPVADTELVFGSQRDYAEYWPTALKSATARQFGAQIMVSGDWGYFYHHDPGKLQSGRIGSWQEIFVFDQ